jgi:hypothetical protein
MKKINLYFTAGLAYITFWVGAAYGYIDVPPHMTKPFEWHSVLLIAVVFSIPFILGWQAANSNSQRGC